MATAETPVAAAEAKPGVLEQLRANPRLPLIVGVAIAVTLLVAMAMWSMGPSYGVLFSNLSDRDGGEIIAELEQMQVPYKFAGNGNTIMVRRDITVLEHDVLHIPYLEPRGVVTATLRLPTGPELTVFGMHLDLSGLWRVRQARAIAELAQAAQQERPTLLAGDLNEWRPNGGCLKEFARHFTLLDCGRSFHSQRPLGRLDRIMHGAPLEAIEAGVHRSPLASIASDHLPVWATFRLPG